MSDIDLQRVTESLCKIWAIMHNLTVAIESVFYPL